MISHPSPADRGHGWTLLIRYGTPCLIYLAAAPFGAGWAACLWLAVVVALLTARNRAERAEHARTRAAMEGLLGLAYALAAFFLLETGATAADVLATTMLGVGLFATLIRDYRDLRRLAINVTPYLAVIVIVQVGSVREALQHGRPELISTIVAAPLLVGNIFMIMHRDLTAAHGKLSVALAEAQAAARAKADFLANMSHEIRTPLNAVLGYAGLLERSRELGARDLSHVRAIQVGGNDLLAVVNDILDASRLEAGKLMLSLSPARTADFLRESIHLFEPLAASRSLQLRLELSEPLPDLLVVDAARLRQVLSNLISNALKFTVAGEVVVRAGYDPSARQLAIEVTDTGVGIAPQALPHLFERFIQVDTSPARRSTGSGLGLSIAKGLIDLMGGEIGAASAVGVGSTFWVRLPAEPTEAAPPAPEGSPGAPEGELSGLFPRRVLVVDDHPANRALIRTVLQSQGHDVEEASDGLEAVRLVRERSFDLVLMDLNMPGMDGYEATAAIRRSGGTSSRMPIIAVSADAMPEQVRLCLDAGLDDHLAKPISAAALLKIMNRWARSSDAAHLSDKAGHRHETAFLDSSATDRSEAAVERRSSGLPMAKGVPA